MGQGTHNATNGAEMIFLRNAERTSVKERKRIKLLLLFYYLFFTAIGLTPGGSSTVHIYTQTVHRIQRTEHT
jgi:hypothetical protein